MSGGGERVSNVSWIGNPGHLTFLIIIVVPSLVFLYFLNHCLLLCSRITMGMKLEAQLLKRSLRESLDPITSPFQSSHIYIYFFFFMDRTSQE